MKTNKLDSFESFVNNSLSGEEVAYNPSDWNDLSNRLNNIAPKPFYKKSWFLGGAAAIVIGVSSFAYYTNSNVEETQSTIAESKQESNPIIITEEKVVTNETEIEAVEEVVTQDELNNIKPISSETKGKEEIVNEPTNNHQKPQSSLPISSTTVSNEEGEENTIAEVDVAIPLASYNTKSNLSGCKGLIVEFAAEKQSNVTYLWSFGDGEYSSERIPTHQYDVSGTYQVELIVQSTIDERILTKSDYETSVVVFEDPNLEILTNKTLENGLATIEYSFVGDDVSNVYWNLGNGTSTSDKEIATTYKKRGNYKVLLEVTSLKGCKSITEKNVFVEEDYNLLAPNTFTPNGDGLNDLFIPEALKIMKCDFKMVVRSRTNGIVFETSSISRPWDGKNQKTGTECSKDVYVWIVSLVNDKGVKEQYTGTVTIN